MIPANHRVVRGAMAMCLLALLLALPGRDNSPAAIRFRNVAANAGIRFVLENDPTARKHLVETMAGGVAAFDYDGDGLTDIYFTNGGSLPSLEKTSPRYWNRLYRNLGGFRFQDVTESAGVAGAGYSMGAAAADYDNDGHVDLFVAGVGRNILYHNRGDGTFEDVTATSGIFDSSSKSLGVALLDYDQDGWPDLVVANDTQPNKLYRNNRNGTFKEVAVDAGVAFSTDGKARAGMGVDTADFTNSGAQGIAITNFDNEMLGLYRPSGKGAYDDAAIAAGVGAPTKSMLGFGCVFADFDLDGSLDLAIANGHIDDTVRNIRGNVGYAQPPQLFLNQGKGMFRDATSEAGPDFSQPKVGRGLAYADFDRDGDVDLLLTTNNGPAYLFRNDQLSNGQGANQSIRLRLVGTQSNRDAIGAVVRLESGGITQSRLVKSGCSYLSQSELPLTFGVGKKDQADRIVVQWPNGRT